jgi:WD40 repeat protein
VTRGGGTSGAAPELTAAQYTRIKALFAELCDGPPAEREARLARLMEEDAVVGRELLAMLEVDARDGVFGPTDAGSANGGTRGPREVAVASLTLPGRIGPYRVLRLLGEGGMGRVYEAAQDFPRRTVALKVVRFGTIAPSMLRRFQQEADILGRLQHPGIAQIFEAGQTDVDGQALPYFAMELVDGPPLTRFAEQRGLSVRQRLELIIRVCDAVHHAHEKGVVHRDLKPGNILVDALGQPKVLDFGVARAAEIAGHPAITMTMEGQILGTLAYMAPEQAQGGEGKAAPAADVYALGAIAFELLTGRPPHDLAGLSLATALHILMHEPAPRVGGLDPMLRGDVETIVGKALEMEPARRYANAAAMGADIRRHLESRPITARPAGRLYRARKFIGRHRALAAGAAATLVTLCSGLTVSIVLGLAERAQRQLAQERETQARGYALKASGTLVNAALAARDPSHPWPAVGQLDSVPAQFVGWEARYVAGRLPWVLTGGHVGSPSFADEDGRVATCDGSGEGAVWEVQDPWSAQPVAPREGGSGPNLGRYVAAVIEPERVAVIDPATRGVLWSIRPPAPALEADCSADGSTLLAVMSNEFVCYRSGRESYRKQGSTGQAAVSSDGRFISIRMGQDTALLLDGGDGRVLHSCPPGKDSFGGLSPSGASYYFADATQPLTVIDPQTLAVRWQLDGLTAALPTVRYSPDETLMAMVLADGSLQVRNAVSGALIRELGRQASGTLSFSRDNSGLVLTDSRGRCTVWDLRTGKSEAAFDHGHGDRPVRVEISPSTRRLVLCSPVGDRPWVVDLDHPWQDEPLYTELKGHTQWVYHVAVSHDGTMIASAAPMDPIVRLWDAFTGEQVAGFARGCNTLSFEAFLAFSSDDASLVTTSNRPGSDNLTHAATVISWDLATGAATFDDSQPPVPLTYQDDLIPRIAARLGSIRGTRLSARTQFSPAGDVVARGGFDGGPHPVTLRSMPSLRPIATLAPDIEGIAYHPGGRYLACGSTGRFQILDLTRGAGQPPIVDVPVQSFSASRHLAYALAYSPDGSRLAVGLDDGSVTIYETEFYQPMLSLPPHHGARYSYVYALAWTPDGTRLISASGDTTLRIWDGLAPMARHEQVDAMRAAGEPMRRHADELVASLGSADNAWAALAADSTLSAESRWMARKALIEAWAGRPAR